MQRRSNSLLLWLYPVVLVLALGVMAWGIYLMSRNPGDRMVFVAGCVSAFVVLATWVMNLNLHASAAESAATREAAFAPVNERLQQMSVLLHQISDQQLISERAKAIAYRDKDREALRRAIREDAARKDWDAALLMVNDIESVFGYKQEAEQLRGEIEALRDADVRKHVEDALAVIDRHCREEQWTLAMREADRIKALYVNNVQAQHLPQDVEGRRQQFKRQLLDGWNDAVTRYDIDGSIEILRKLDLYLTPAEAASMQETARQVFKDKLLLLGQQFTLAVKEHNWQEAVRLGERIASEFPNSRMAKEVRDKMDLLRERAPQNPEAANV